VGIRVNVEDETEGLDMSEHGMRSYAQSAIDDSLILEESDGEPQELATKPARARLGAKELPDM
jgi:hypothetical protein